MSTPNIILDHRGHGDIWTLTVQEYLSLAPWKRLWYRIYRHPVVMFGFGPLYIFLIRHRFWHPRDSIQARGSTMRTNGGLLIIVVVMSLTIGFQAYLLIQLPIILLAAVAGVWLFYIQHQFQGTYWERHDKWRFVREACEGASFYKLPRILQWFTGSIGFHHVHHLGPRIPNYYLQKCHESESIFRVCRGIIVVEIKGVM